MIPRLFRSIWIWTAGVALILFWVPLMSVIRVFDRDPLRLRTGRWFRRLGRNLARLSPWRLHISGWEHLVPGQPYVVVSNHQSLADIPLICFLRLDAKWLAKAELFRVPAVGTLLRLAGDIPVDRSDRRNRAGAFRQATECIRRKCSVVFFPEGTRSVHGEIAPFIDGPFRLALREGVPILPLVLDGSGAALPKNTWLFGGIQDLYLQVLEPVDTVEWEQDQSATLRDAVRQRMIEELHRMRAAARG